MISFSYSCLFDRLSAGRPGCGCTDIWDSSSECFTSRRTSVRIMLFLQAPSQTVVRQLVVLKTNYCINCFYCTYSDAAVVIQAGEVARRRRSQSRSRRNSRSGWEPPPLFVEPNRRFSQESECQGPVAQCKLIEIT